jgi:hypothetical protein
MAASYSFRIETAEFTRFAAVLKEVGASSGEAQQALNQLMNSSPQLADSMQRAEQSAQRVVAAHREIETATTASSRGFASMGQIVQSAGYQMQDFVVQVQGGTSALVALSQQGSQFLGMFGPAGAIAGVVLAIGSVAAKFLFTGDSAKSMADSAEAAFKGISAAAESTASIIEKVNALFRSTAQNAIAARQATIEGLRAQVASTQSSTLARQDEAASDLQTARTKIAETQRQLDTPGLPLLARRRLERDLQGWQETAVGAERWLGQQSTQMGALNEQAARLAQIGPEQLGPEAPDGLSRRAGGGGGGGGRRRGGGGGGSARIPRPPADPAIAQEKDDERIASEAARVVESVDPATRALNQFNDAVAKIGAAGALYDRTQNRDGGALGLSPDQVEKTYAELKDKFLTTIDDGKARTDNLAASARSFGSAFTGAFDNILASSNRTWGGVFAGTNRASQAVHQLEQVAAKFLTQTFITKPLENAANGLFGGNQGGGKFSQAGAGGGGLGGLFNNLFGSWFGGGAKGDVKPDALSGLDSMAVGGDVKFAGGGVMTQWGPVPLRAYAGGGVASSPQAAIFGEGAQPEAYVPLPDGRRIPVAMQGGGGGHQIFIDARGAEVGVEQRVNAAIQRQLPGIVNITKMSLGADVQRGGNAAAMFGRRQGALQ